jgi:phosphohistidine phosphatase
MKRLYLIRHAKSSWKEPMVPDFERPLNKRGKRDAPLMGKRLHSSQLQPDLLISSPAKRAVKTAKIIAEEIGFPKKRIVYDESIYEAGVSALIHLIRHLENSVNQVLLVGHNPGLTMVAEFLTDTAIGNIPTCGIVCVEFPTDSWEKIEAGSGTMLFFDAPKKYA